MADWSEIDGVWIQRGAREKVLASLPRNVIGLIEEIELFAGTQIEFRDKSILLSAGETNVGVESVFATHTHAYISLPDLDSVNASAIIHELLHLRRYWVEQVPQIEATTNRSPFVELAANIDNAVEHLSIVPRERDYGFNPAPYWNKIVEGYWRDFPWLEVGPQDRRMRCLLGWLSLPLIDSNALAIDIRARVASAGLLADAQKFLVRIQSLPSKVRIASAVFRFLQIPRNNFELVVLDIRNRKSERRSIPEH
ncbi:hypothetical protein [Bradyrhizobium japonicum]|uniref:hypothetical protein n=1 Tax=Bradyrhizobium japonicum TaxID=375 RepID=UPI002714D35B|nr:hypothetical protein [Bradyrhizobium japonicum]WLB58044.1 hypothetical protein QIH94_19260 [Bradyrhizobium japonicum]WLB60088.1 hypothetical protein QIH96_26675 [Bradyrhizobium japonicum]